MTATRRSEYVKTLAATFSALALILASALGHAAPAAPTAAQPPTPNWYNVEVIVFRTVDPAAGNNETWPVDPGLPDWNTALPLGPANSIGPAVPYQALSPVNEQLDEDWTRLKRSHDYQPLVHVSWTQPALDRATAPTIRIGVPPSALPQAFQPCIAGKRCTRSHHQHGTAASHAGIWQRQAQHDGALSAFRPGSGPARTAGEEHMVDHTHQCRHLGAISFNCTCGSGADVPDLSSTPRQTRGCGQTELLR